MVRGGAVSRAPRTTRAGGPMGGDQGSDSSDDPHLGERFDQTMIGASSHERRRPTAPSP